MAGLFDHYWLVSQENQIDHHLNDLKEGCDCKKFGSKLRSSKSEAKSN